jgi:GT2 family glycosyltransferase/glycosyltransferase involved in cell wall biosynthesis
MPGTANDAGGDEGAERRALIAEVARQQRDAELAECERDAALRELEQVEASVAWSVLKRVRRRVYGAIGGRDSRAGRALGRLLARVGRVEQQVVDRRRWRTLRLPAFPAPDVSIVIAVRSDAELVERCLRAIVAAGDAVAYEAIAVADPTGADCGALLRAVEGIRVIEGEEGYPRGVNRAAAVAHGRHVVLLADDSEPQPGWLEALVTRAESASDVGIVAAKLVYPNGDLRAAAGIVWRDGSAESFGDRRAPDAPEFDYAREVDYGSAAALLVRTDVWRATGGLDERYRPGGYAAVDLCFAARKLGWRVLYEPRAVVTHAAGAPGPGDRELFAATWDDALREQLPGPAPDRAYVASNRRRGPLVLIADHRVPMPDRDAGSLRMSGIVEVLLELGCRVVFHPDDQQQVEPYGQRLRALGVEVVDRPLDPARMAALGDDLVLAILSRPAVVARHFQLVREHAPQATIAYDTVDLHFLRERRRREQAAGGDQRIVEGLRALEAAMASAADVTLVVSDDERRQLADLAPEARIAVVPNVNPVVPAVPGPEDRSGLLFVGGFQHAPNADAAATLVRDVMPLVWDEWPDAELTIAGGNVPAEVAELAGPRVDVAGWVEDLDPLLTESLALVAPLRFGAGLKGKVTQALAAGLPVVTTPFGAEGLGAADGDEILVADDDAGIAERILRLRDHATWREVSAGGQAIAERVCSPAVLRAAVDELLTAARRSASS